LKPFGIANYPGGDGLNTPVKYAPHATGQAQILGKKGRFEIASKEWI
jgi:hypothetical protein